MVSDRSKCVWVVCFIVFVTGTLQEIPDDDCSNPSVRSNGEEGRTVNNNIQFTVPDLTLKTTDDLGDAFQLTGYKLHTNDEIISLGRPSRYGELRWVSLGQPALRIPPNNGQNKHIFSFTPRGFYTHLDLLTEEHRVLLAEQARKQYKGTGIKASQIFLIPLISLHCQLDFVELVDETKPVEHSISGVVQNLDTFPYRIDFDAPQDSALVRTLQKLINESVPLGRQPDVAVSCTAKGTGKAPRTSTLVIKFEQMQELNIGDRLFGDGDEKYVSRHQASELASEIFSSLNVYEEYDVGAEDFEDNFVAELVKKLAADGFQSVAIDKALGMMSAFAVDFADDLKPDVITREMSSLFTVEEKNDKSHIIVNKTAYAALQTKNNMNAGASVDVSYGPISASASVKYAEENERASVKSTASLDDQLKEMNRYSEEHVEWERSGTIIKPKSVNVVKMQKSSFSKKLALTRVKRVMYEAAFEQDFTLRASSIKSQATSYIGTTYTRWGNKDCPEHARKLNSGVMAGGSTHGDGGGHDYICLSDTPQWRYDEDQEAYGTLNSESGNLLGVRNSLQHPLPTSGNQQTAVCAVCHTPMYSTTIMIPGWTRCPEDWRMEYSGWVTAAKHDYARTEYVCLDGQAETREVHSTPQNQNNTGLLYGTQLVCVALPCEKQHSVEQLACVVCSA